MQNFVVITALTGNRSGLVNAFSKTIKESGCSMIDSRMTVMGNEFAMFSLLAGSWDAIAKIEDALPRLEKELDATIASKRTLARQPATDLMPYAVEAVATDKPGIVYEIAHFFSRRDINIEDMHTNSYEASHTGTPMFSLHMTVSVPTNTSIASLRGEFLDFCDQLNLDSIMEPVK